MFADLMRKKSLDEILAAPEAGHERGLKRNLTAFSLTMLGIGAVIGAGIFSSVGTAAAGGADHLGAGPALVVSFIMTAIACGFAALTLLPMNRQVVSAEYKINFLRPAVGEKFIATGRVRRAGKSMSVCEGEVEAVKDGKRILIAVMLATMVAVPDEG